MPHRRDTLLRVDAALHGRHGNLSLFTLLGFVIGGLDHEARLMPLGNVKPCMKRGKTVGSDAEAIFEAFTLPTMRFVVEESID